MVGHRCARRGMLSLAAVAVTIILLSRPASSFVPQSTTALRTQIQHTQHEALLDPYLLETASSSLLSADATAAVGSSADSIKTAFSVATFLPQPFWLFLILLPNTGITKRLFGDLNVITAFCLVHFFIVVASIMEPGGTAPMAEFNDVFDPSGDPQAAMLGMMRYPNFVSEEWSHVLTWDLFVGRWIWLDGIKRGVFTSHSVLLCNLIGPPGLLLHWATCIVTGKGLTPSEVPVDEGES